ncbi:hypothetical protein GTO10_06650 [Candidatus Saccharibacteria bacterium]|nr:hypothetical protein [Candidatus Saccharibacteria bacterium]
MDKFPEDKRTEVLFGRWSLKDILAHMSAWDLYSIECLDALKRGKEPKWDLHVNAFNARAVKKRKDWTFKKVYKEWIEAGEKLIKAYRRLPEEIWDKKFWPNRRFTPKKFLEIDLEHYRDKHLPQLKKFLP